MNAWWARTPVIMIGISRPLPDVFAGCDRAIALRQDPLVADESMDQHHVVAPT
jgi:hypothetical protein